MLFLLLQQLSKLSPRTLKHVLTFYKCPPFPGLGFALCYTPSIAMVGCYFHRRKALAYGLAMSGSGIGTFILAPAVQVLIELYSWRGALLILSAFVANLCVCGALLRPITLREDEAEGEGEEGESVGEERLGEEKHCTTLLYNTNTPMVLLVLLLLSRSTSRQQCCIIG